MSLVTGGLIDPIKALCWRLHRQTPGLSQEEIARKVQKNQSQVSRYIAEVDEAVTELKGLCASAGGDPDVVDSYLALAEQKCPKSLLRA